MTRDYYKGTDSDGVCANLFSHSAAVANSGLPSFELNNMCDVSQIMSTAAVSLSAAFLRWKWTPVELLSLVSDDRLHAHPVPASSCDWQPLQLHDTDDLFPGVTPRGMGQPAAVPKKVADLTRYVHVTIMLQKFRRSMRVTAPVPESLRCVDRFECQSEKASAEERSNCAERIVRAQRRERSA